MTDYTRPCRGCGQAKDMRCECTTCTPLPLIRDTSFPTTAVDMTDVVVGERFSLRFLSPTAFPTPGTVMQILDDDGTAYGTATVLPDGGLRLHADPR